MSGRLAARSLPVRAGVTARRWRSPSNVRHWFNLEELDGRARRLSGVARMLWIQRTSSESMNDAALKDYLRESHRLASLNLPKKTQRALGLNSA
jgi:hypothetical protein